MFARFAPVFVILGLALSGAAARGGPVAPAPLISLDETLEMLGLPPTGGAMLEAACCKHCSKGKACGDSCIARDKTCHQGAGCACD